MLQHRAQAGDLAAALLPSTLAVQCLQCAFSCSFVTTLNLYAGTIVHAGLYAALVARLDWRGEAHHARNRVGSSKAAPQPESELYPTSTSCSETALGGQQPQETQQLLRSTQLQV